MRWLQVTDLEGNVHLASARETRCASCASPTTRSRPCSTCSKPSRPIAWRRSPGSSPREHAGVFDRFSWADLVGGRLGHRLTVPLTPPEVWGAGVTYRRSARLPRGRPGIYDKVYEAERPELFFKATASRLRRAAAADRRAARDSTFTAAEPELALVIGRGGAILGYTLAQRRVGLGHRAREPALPAAVEGLQRLLRVRAGDRDAGRDRAIPTRSS